MNETQVGFSVGEMSVVADNAIEKPKNAHEQMTEDILKIAARVRLETHADQFDTVFNAIIRVLFER